MEDIVIIIPVFNDWPALKKLFPRIANLSNDYSSIKLLIVDDGSTQLPDDVEFINQYKLSGDILYLSRNLGHQRAIAIALCKAAETIANEIVVVMDGDGEDMPEDIPSLIEGLQNSSKFIAVAERAKRSEGMVFSFFYKLYKVLFHALTRKKMTFGNFSALRPKVVKRIVQMEELWLHYPATLLASSYKIDKVVVNRGSRILGESKMKIVNLVRHGFQSIAVFQSTALIRIMFCALVVVLTCITLIVIAVFMKLVGAASPGWLTTVAGTLLGLITQGVIISLLSLLFLVSNRPSNLTAPVALFNNFVEKIQPFGNGFSAQDKR